MAGDANDGAAPADVTLDDVIFKSDSAVGGAGGARSGSGVSGGGGGLGGAGGSGASHGGGGGGVGPSGFGGAGGGERRRRLDLRAPEAAAPA